MARLGDVCTKAASNIAQKDLQGREGSYPVYGAGGFITNVDFYQREAPYIAVVKDGAGVGRVMKLPGRSSVIGTMQYILPGNLVNIDYLAFAMEHMDLGRYQTGAAIPHIYFKDYRQEELPLPGLERQAEIAAVLNRMVTLISLRKRQLEKLDALVNSRFVELFGDPILNPFQWPVKSLLDLGYCKNGMNFHEDDEGIKIPFLSVSDFKNHSIIDGTGRLSQISLNEYPSEEYLLRDGDLVFVRSNGSKTLVGRCLAVYPHSIPAVFSGFCIRFRKTSGDVMTYYLLHVFKTGTVRKKLTGRGANIQNLNQQTLASLNIPVPSLELQEQFAAFVTRTEKAKASIQKSLDQLETLKKSLMQEYFAP